MKHSPPKDLGGALAVKEELIYSGYVNGSGLGWNLSSAAALELQTRGMIFLCLLMHAFGIS